MGHNLLECLSEVPVEVAEVFFDCLFFLVIQLRQQDLNAVFCPRKALGLSLKLGELLQVLLVPFLTVAVLPRELV